jgi:hypothetical protein
MLLMSTIVGYSQTEKGKKILGGQLNFYGNKGATLDSLSSSRTTYSTLQLNPNVGYFIKDNFALGVLLNVGFSNQSQNNQNSISTYYYKTNTINFGAGAFARYYKKIGDRFSFFVNGNMLYNHQISKTESTSSKQEKQANSINLGFSPGLVYFPSPKLGIEVLFGNINYTYTSSVNKTVSYKNHDNRGGYGLNLSPSSLYLGMNYYF